MRKFRRVFKQVVLVVLLCAMVIGCAARPDETPVGEGNNNGSKPTTKDPDTEQLTVVTVPKRKGNLWWDSCDIEGSAWAEENNAKHYYIADTDVDSALQLQSVNDAMAHNPDIMVAVPINLEAMDEVFYSAREKGTLVIAHEGARCENIDYNVDPVTPEEYGANFAEKAYEIVGDEEIEYALVVGLLTLSSHNEWIQAFYDYASEHYPNMKTLNETEDNGERVIGFESNNNADDAYKMTKELIQKNPNLKVIYTTSASAATGIGRAITELDKIGEVSLLAIATASEMEQHVKSGAAPYVSFWYPGYATAAGYEIGKRVLAGETIQTGDDLGIEGYRNITVKDGKLVYGDFWYDVTKDNVDELSEIL